MYTINGKPVPSVTKITGVINKPALVFWAVNETVDYLANVLEPDRIYTQEQIESMLLESKSARFKKSQKALNIGSMAHDWLEGYVRAKLYGTREPDLPDYEPVLNSVTSYLEWEKSAGDITYESSEKRVCSERYMYSGTVDLTFVLDGKRIVADFKTSKDIYPEYFIQCAAYARAIEEESGVEVDEIAVIRIPKDGGEVDIRFDEVNSNFDIFKACLLIWRWHNNWS